MRGRGRRGGGGSIYLTSITLNPTSVTGGMANSTGTATLSGAAPTGGAVVTLSSNNTAAAVPASVTVPAGQTHTTFTVTTSTVTTVQTATITGNYNAQQSAPLTITPVGYHVDVASLSLVPAGVTGGSGSTGTVTLTSAAAGNTVVSLGSSNTAVATVPPSVTVLSGQTTASFGVTTTPVATQTGVTLTATLVSSQTATLNVFPPQLDNTNGVGIALSPHTTPGGISVTGTLNLTGPAYAGGCAVAVDTDHDSAVRLTGGTFPANIVVPAGQSSTTFTIVTSRVNRLTTVTFTATFAGTSVQDTLTLTPANLYVTDARPYSSTQGEVHLAWDCHAVGNFILTRNGVTIATLPNTTSTYVDQTIPLFTVPDTSPPLGYTILTSSWHVPQGGTFPIGDLNGKGTLYQIFDANSPNTPLSADQVSFYMASATAAQTVDSRIDPRYATIHYIDHNFGITTYRGGLFTGYVGDGGKVGRSFLSFILDWRHLLFYGIGTTATLRCGNISAFCTMAYTTQNSDQHVKVTMGQTGTNWDPTTLVWSNSQSLTPGNGQTITVDYTPSTTPGVPPGYEAWPFGDLLKSQIDAQLALPPTVAPAPLAFALVVPDETVYGWAYFAKTNYSDPTRGAVPPFYTYTVDLPIPLSLQLTPSTVMHGSTVTGTLVVNGVGVGDTAAITLSSVPAISGWPTFVSVTGYNQTFTFTAPATAGTYTISATANGVTASKTLTVQ